MHTSFIAYFILKIENRDIETKHSGDMKFAYKIDRLELKYELNS